MRIVRVTKQACESEVLCSRSDVHHMHRDRRVLFCWRMENVAVGAERCSQSAAGADCGAWSSPQPLAPRPPACAQVRKCPNVATPLGPRCASGAARCILYHSSRASSYVARVGNVISTRKIFGMKIVTVTCFGPLHRPTEAREFPIMRAVEIYFRFHVFQRQMKA